MHKKSIDIEPWKEPRRDSRGPLQFLNDFEAQVAEKLGNEDHITGEIFMSVVKRSPWCFNWRDSLRIEMGYFRMKQIFVEMEWTIEVQEFYYEEFKKENRDNSKFVNFLDYVNYRTEKLEGTEYSERYIVERFRNNLPDRIQAKINLNRVKTIKAFVKVVGKIPYKDLQWSALHQAIGMDKRQELLAKMGVKGYEKKI